MLGLFKSRGERELSAIVESMMINLQNNYKEPAHSDRKRIRERAEALYANNKISEAVYKKYIRIYDEYTVKLKDYRH